MKSSVIAFLSAFISIAHFAQCQNSVLSEGNWYKLAVEQTGIYRIDYNDLVSYGIDPTQINPVNIRLYGNGSGMLPEDPDAFRYDDLQENAIFVFGEEDETFDPGDYILFYGEAPTEWALNSATGFFEHQVNLYSDYTFYFLNFDLGQGKRIQDQYSTIIPPNYLCTSFDDHFYHEAELENLIHSGKKWYGERFEDVTQHSFPVSFSGLVQDEQVYMKVAAAARSYITSNLILSIDNQDMLTLSFSPVSGSSLSSDFAKYRIDTLLFYADQSNFTVKLTYDKPMDSSIAWLDYLTLNARRKLAYDNGQLSFRDKESTGSGKVTTFQITTSNSNFELWNITDPLNPSSVHYLSTDTTAVFTLETDSLLEFIAFNANSYFAPLFIGETENQNLHGLNPVDLLIITDDDFKPSAQQLASFRENHDGLSTFVTTPGKIYNEFSSGTKDITAIRDFIKFMYNKSNGEKPEYVLFFGDATYDYKNITNTEVNFIPVWESEESLNLVSSYCSDDYFGEFNESEKTGLLSVALGRLPVKTIEEANAVVQKIISYSSSENAYGSWRNDFCCIADDEDGNLHFMQSEQISELVDTTDQNFNISKIYLDAYEQISDTNGQFYPDVNQVITNRINTGVSIINYIGHGFYNGLAHEKILTENDIDNWENFNFYPLMFTATCEFGRFDDPDRYGLAEKAILLQGKGMAAIIAPSRATYSNGNSDFQNNFYSVLLNQTETTLGKAVQFAKQQTGGYENARKYFLFGDPSMKLAIPEYTIVTEAINGMSVANPLDTVHPGEPVIVSGFITDISGEPVYNFNGTMEVRVFERKDTLYTLANDPASSVAEFTVRDSVLVTLNTDILNGQFAFSFNIPYNINDEYGTVKFSYYAIDYPEDASGQFSGLVAGGIYNAISENVSVVDNIAVYPTVVASELWCLAKQDISDLKLDIYDPGGRKILSVSEKNMTAGSRRSIDVTVLNPGLYIVRLNADNRFTPFKIIKR